MDRMKPPPTYYGNPYRTGDMEPGMPYGQNQMNGMPPYQGQMGSYNNQPPMPNNGPVNNGDNNYNPNTTEMSPAYDQTLENYVGKTMKVYCSFPDSAAWHDVIFEGTLMYAALDRVILKDINKKQLVVIVGVYVNYIEIPE